MRTPIVLAAILGGAALAAAAQIGVVGTKLIMVDKITFGGKAKVIYVSKDAAIAKGSSTDVAGISATFDYGYDATAGRLFMPSGAFNGDEGWQTNSAAVAKYYNRLVYSPGAATPRVGIVKPGVLIKVVSKGLGSPPNAIDIVTAGPPTGDVHTAFTVDNLGEINSMCSTFSDCTYKLIAGDSGAKLVCKDGTPDPTCAALGSPSGAFLD